MEANRFFAKGRYMATGVLLHVLLMDSPPFQGNSVEAIFDAIKTI
jgi:hypothetical protein